MHTAQYMLCMYSTLSSIRYVCTVPCPVHVMHVQYSVQYTLCMYSTLSSTRYACTVLCPVHAMHVQYPVQYTLCVYRAQRKLCTYTAPHKYTQPPYIVHCMYSTPYILLHALSPIHAMNSLFFHMPHPSPSKHSEVEIQNNIKNVGGMRTNLLSICTLTNKGVNVEPTPPTSSTLSINSKNENVRSVQDK